MLGGVRMRKPGVEVDLFVKRMRSIGIEVKLVGNIPWIYLDKINDVKVTEKHLANHGYTIAWFPIMIGSPLKWDDMKKTFNLIRKYTGRTERGKEKI